MAHIKVNIACVATTNQLHALAFQGTDQVDARWRQFPPPNLIGFLGGGAQGEGETGEAWGFLEKIEEP